MKLSHLMIAAAALAIPAAASAHRMWMLPSATVVSGTESWVTVDAAVSNDLFFFDHQPLRLEQMKVWQPDGSAGQLQNGSTGRYRSTFDVQLNKPGTWKIGTAMSGVMGSFKVNGEEKRVGGRGGPPRPGMPAPLTVADIPADATDVKLTESSTRNEIFVTAGEPTTTVFAPTNTGLEMAPITHPDELVSGEAAKFRFLIDGKAAANLKVTVIPGGKRYRDAEGAMELTTGADGVLSVTWPSAGMYWLNATATDAKTMTPRATQRRMSYVTTLEVLTP
ncbi:DUF4198 domain-containing protein [Microvirga sp. SRT01]|uniref:DUF4198 domain-containing protein n=1 Tax=Sphingomonas longa TaxID=2778730 RepID=A0ABS2D6I1_9SPHN|nr:MULTISPECIES: DUF4198 domain-containing protein [Alphaproteobacteria]MBM6576534.1 DUF4198 domain-containing protein [Sphingomonas sp. BT552]MBR7709580.1 DUF4198 domain-containing protein [Microvirga sp. SRT01]